MSRSDRQAGSTHLANCREVQAFTACATPSVLAVDCLTMPNPTAGLPLTRRPIIVKWPLEKRSAGSRVVVKLKQGQWKLVP